MKKTIWFDLDGTLYNLYKIEDWLPRLRAEDFSVYNEDMPRNKHERIAKVIAQLSQMGWDVGVITWAGKGYHYRDPQLTTIAKIKRDWVKKYFPTLANCHFSCIPYGESKADYILTVQEDGDINILVDDSKEVRADWRKHGKNFLTINASRSFVKGLEGLLG